MTVKCLSELDQQAIAFIYSNGTQTVDELARDFGTSTRTIYRVLFDMGVNKAPVRKSKVKPIPVLTELHIDMIELSFIEKVQCMLKAIFWKTPKQDNAQISK